MPSKLPSIPLPEDEDQSGVPVDFGGPVYPNPNDIEPKEDTAPGQEPVKLDGAKLSTDNAPLGMPKMDTSPAPIDNGMQPLGGKLASTGEKAPAAPATAPKEDLSAIANGPTAQPTSILGDKVAPGAAIAPGQMHEAGKAQFHDQMRDFGDKEATNRASMLALDPNDPQYLQKLAAHQAQQGLLKSEQAHFQQMHPWGSQESAHPGFLGKIGHVLGEVGNAAGGNALDVPGSQANLAGKVAEGEGETKEATANALTGAQQGLANARPEIENKKLGISEEKNDIASDKNAAINATNLRKYGLKLDDTGNAVPLAPEELSQNENAALTLKHAQADGAEARKLIADMRGDPNSPENAARQQRLKILAMNAATAAGHLGLDKDKYVADYFGTDAEGNPLPGAQTDENGKPIGSKIAAANNPSGQRLNKSDLAQNLQFNAGELKNLITRHPDLFGKVAGRFTTVDQMIGSNDPAISQVGTIVHNMAMANMGIHGMRSAEEVRAGEQIILNHFRNSPEATIAGIDEINNSAQTFVDAAKHGKLPAPTPQHPGQTGGSFTVPEGAPAAPAEDNHKLKQNNKVIAISRGGKWQAP